ncbi:hypothetical protein HanRHA438_Chr01g0041501 [Helianthus annuus]|nr:hypothetical protein HanIR_Chr01g0045101 [Helianthus annuus]KAJ0949702.1 hypothetical protein HanRHA438_Chr01g0041501 [Helianthus annuus]
MLHVTHLPVNSEAFRVIFCARGSKTCKCDDTWCSIQPNISLVSTKCEIHIRCFEAHLGLFIFNMFTSPT